MGERLDTHYSLVTTSWRAERCLRPSFLVGAIVSTVRRRWAGGDVRFEVSSNEWQYQSSQASERSAAWRSVGSNCRALLTRMRRLVATSLSLPVKLAIPSPLPCTRGPPHRSFQLSILPSCPPTCQFSLIAAHLHCCMLRSLSWLPCWYDEHQVCAVVLTMKREKGVVVVRKVVKVDWRSSSVVWPGLA